MDASNISASPSMDVPVLPGPLSSNSAPGIFTPAHSSHIPARMGLQVPSWVPASPSAPQECLNHPFHTSSRVMLTPLSHTSITVILDWYFLTHTLFSLPFPCPPYTLIPCSTSPSSTWADTSAPLFWHQTGVLIKQDWSNSDIILTQWYLQLSTGIFLTILLTFRYCHPPQFDITIVMSPPQWPLHWHYHQIGFTISWNIKGKERLDQLQQFGLQAREVHFWRQEWMCWVAAGVTAGIEGNLVDRKANKCLRDTALEKEKKRRHKIPNNKKGKTKKPWKKPEPTKLPSYSEEFRIIKNYYNKT